MTAATATAGSPRQSKLGAVLRNEEILAWGWRIPFFVGCAIVPLIFILRRSLLETEDFLARKHHPSVHEIFQSLLEHWAVVIEGMLLVAMTTTTFYLIGGMTPFMSTYLIERTGDKAAPAYWMSLAAACSLVAILLLLRRARQTAT